MDLKTIRIERLRAFARSRGVADSPAELGRLIGKKPNQVTNLLGGHSSFGEKVARSIEEAVGLPRGWLDEAEETGAWAPSLESLALARAIDSIQDPDARAQVLKLCHGLVDLQVKSLTSGADQAQQKRKQA